MKLLLAGFLVAGTLLAGAVPLKLTEKGEAAAQIIIDRNAPPPVHLAARELQSGVRMISGARLPILNGVLNNRHARVYLGTLDSELMRPVREKYPSDAEKLQGSDGYTVRRIGNHLYLYASQPRGVLNGVHRLLMRNTDLIWVRPYRELAVFTTNPDLMLKENDYLDIPRFCMRGWGANRNIALLSEEFELFASRLGCNYTVSLQPQALGRRLDHGFILEFGGGHNIGGLWLPVKKFGREHPEFYMLVNGRRRAGSKTTQLCLSNREMEKAFIANTLEIVESLPEYYTRINIMIEDTPAVCECPACKEPVSLPDGRVLTAEHEAFRSTQFFLFLNRIAEAVYRKNPKLEVKAFGYFFSAVPPEIPLFKTVTVSFCPYIRNDKETLHGAGNAKWLERTKKWASMTPNLIWREYYYSQAAFPRAQANVIAQDLRFINRLGIKRIYPELSWGDRPDSGAADCPEQEFWDMNAPEFWTVTQLFWNPEADPDALRDEFIRRAYREAAPGVMRFYHLIRDSWLKDPAPSAFNDDYRRSAGRYIVDKKLTVPCRQALGEAAETVRDPRSKMLLNRLRATFERWIAEAVSGTIAEQAVPKAEIRSFPGFDFTSGVWRKAASLPPFRRMGAPLAVPPEATDVKVVHNGETLYAAFRCPFPGKLEAKEKLKHDEWPAGDHAEIFLAGKNGYYHFAFDCNGNRYDARGTDSAWNAPWEVRTEKRSGEWRAVAAIPLKSFDAGIEQNNRIRGLFYRVRPSRGQERTVHSSWGGGKVHSFDTFGELVFALE